MKGFLDLPAAPVAIVTSVARANFAMRSTIRHCLTWSMLAAYACISLLGHGLHWLSPDDGHHHGPNIVSCATHGHSHDAHCVYHEHRDGSEYGTSNDLPSVAGSVVKSTHCLASSHVCEICAFLAMACGDRPRISELIVWRNVVSSTTLVEQLSCSSPTRSPHSPRGPPCLA
jgi:hypothetical protein